MLPAAEQRGSGDIIDGAQVRRQARGLKDEADQNGASLGLSTGPSGNPTETKAAGETGARQFGDACLDLQR
jgi:hypothetical protein